MNDQERILGHRLDRTLFAHTELFSIAEDALSRAKESPSRADFVTAMVMGAFALEAYLNFAGETKLSDWSKLDRSPVRKKLVSLCKYAGFSPDFAQRPYSSLERLRLFRNSMAHARTETLDGPPLEPPDYPETEWEAQCNIENVTQTLEDVRSAILNIHKQAGMTFGALGQIAVQGGQLLVRPPERPKT